MEDKSVSGEGPRDDPATGKAEENDSVVSFEKPCDDVVIETGVDGKELNDKEKEEKEQGASDYFVRAPFPIGCRCHHSPGLTSTETLVLCTAHRPPPPCYWFHLGDRCRYCAAAHDSGLR